jgi:hypothetical protein
MDIIEYITIVFILDGPILGLFYLLYRKCVNEKI